VLGRARCRGEGGGMASHCISGQSKSLVMDSQRGSQSAGWPVSVSEPLVLAERRPHPYSFLSFLFRVVYSLVIVLLPERIPCPARARPVRSLNKRLVDEV
jgi:hypothetical protein